MHRGTAVMGLPMVVVTCRDAQMPSRPSVPLLQATARVREREVALESGRRANDMLSGSLKSVQDEVERLRVALGELKDTAAHWQDQALGGQKELEALQRKVSAPACLHGRSCTHGCSQSSHA